MNKKLRFYDGLKIRLFSESVGFSRLTIFWFEENRILSLCFCQFWKILAQKRNKTQARFLELDIWTKNHHPKVWSQIWPGCGNHQTLIFLCFWQTLQVKVSKLDFLSFHNSHYLTHSHTNVWKIRERLSIYFI